MTDYDHPYKRLFSHPIMMADLIQGFLDSDLVEICDISSLERCNGSYVTDDLIEREDDLIWKPRGGTVRWYSIFSSNFSPVRIL